MSRRVTILVCGSRTYEDYAKIEDELDRVLAHYGADRLQILHGGARGADTHAGWWASQRHVAVQEMRADWSQGKGAGHIRNQRMLTEGAPDFVLAFADKPLAESKGTADMVARSRAAGVPTYVYDRT